MARKKKYNIKSVEKENVSNKVNNKNNNSLLIITLVLVVFQLIVLFGITYNFDSKLSVSTAKISEIESKVTSIDNFFASNVKGYGNENSNSKKTQKDTKSKTGENLKINIVNEPTIGNSKAPVTIVEFSDYECPFCGKWHSESYEKLKKEYIDTGKVKFVFKDFPLGFHKKALPRAIAANCVLKELGDEKYFEYHTIMFNNQATFTDADYKSQALKLGVDETKYDSCIVDSSIKDEIQNDLKEGTSLGISGTPSFFINGNLIVGAQPYSVIKQTIEQELNK